MQSAAFLSGDRVLLRPLAVEDLQGNYPRWFDDEEVCRYNSHHRFPYTVEELAKYIHDCAADKTRITLAIVDKSSGTHIGNVSIQEIDLINAKAEFAIIVGERAFWGKGYAVEASRIIIDHAFLSFQLNRIYCGTSAENTSMQRLADKLGFIQEGRQLQALYKNGTFHDVFLYCLLRSAWARQAESRRA